MKVLSIVLAAFFMAPSPCALKGRVKFVNAHADYKVRVVGAHADARVRLVERFPDDAGEWQPVQNHADFTVQVVTVGEDFTVQYVPNFPKCNL